ncbi:pyridoxal phosphate-dependent transferase [Flagelloscypha sp. PMI_526]|nr:pyridoxal phosphate-dependent transferase [Flagelloscypha sp. PMI_526]
MPGSLLSQQITQALSSRQSRDIFRRLPPPNVEKDTLNFTSNDYLGLASSSHLRSRFLTKLNVAPNVLGSGGSRLLVNGPEHQALEDRLTNFFGTEAGLLFNSGFDANVGFFSCIPQPGDTVVYDEFIHASVHDGLKASRIDKKGTVAFTHNSIKNLRSVLENLLATRPSLRTGDSSMFLAVEALYSMDGTLAPLLEIVALQEELFPLKNSYLIVDEAHSTGIYGPKGKGRVAALGLEDKVFARLHTFGKALAATGAILLTSPLIRSYLVNYARPLIYTTALSTANIILASSSFDLLEDGTATHLSNHLLFLSTHFIHALSPHLQRSVPPSLLRLQEYEQEIATPIIPLLTPKAKKLSVFLSEKYKINARPITWPTVPKGKERVRICLNAGHSKEDVKRLVEGVLVWAGQMVKDEMEELEGETRARM